MSQRVVIIGAGFAGASTAYYLSQQGLRDILIIEREELPGTHASGRNASMIHQLEPDPYAFPMLYEGARFVHSLTASDPSCMAATGSFMLISEEDLAAYETVLKKAKEKGLEVQLLTVGEAANHIPFLRDASFQIAIYCPSDGVVEIHTLLWHYLRGAMAGGAELKTLCEVTDIETHDGRVTAVVTTQGRFEADVVVNAAGAWAPVAGQMAGALSIPMFPYRRHIFQTPPLPWVKGPWPFVWSQNYNVYFRPESGGLLMSPCDEEESPPCLPCINPEAIDWLAEKILECFPSLPDVEVMRSWACLRTFVPDRRFVIGWDPQVMGFFWVSALGGHGVTASSPVGAMAADLIVGKASSDDELCSAFDPKRFAKVKA